MEDLINLTIGRRLRLRRRDLGLSQTDVSLKIGTRFQQVHKYESGECRISAAQLWRLAQALEVDVRYFFDGLLDERPLTCGPSSARAAEADLEDARMMKAISGSLAA